MPTNLYYQLKDCFLFTLINPFDTWYVIYDLSPKPNPTGVLFPNGIVSKEPDVIDFYAKQVRLSLLFPVNHIKINNYETNTLDECLKKIIA